MKLVINSKAEVVKTGPFYLINNIESITGAWSLRYEYVAGTSCLRHFLTVVINPPDVFGWQTWIVCAGSESGNERKYEGASLNYSEHHMEDAALDTMIKAAIEAATDEWKFEVLVEVER